MDDNLNAAAIALAFNTLNERKVWSARANSRDSAERVHFSTTTGMVKLTYDVRSRTFSIMFTKFNAAWGDYVRAVARALHVVLSTLQAAGLPFEAPDEGDEDGIVIRTVTGIGGAITVAYEPPQTIETAIMPEQREKVFSFAPYEMAATTLAAALGADAITSAADAEVDAMLGTIKVDEPPEK